MGQSTDAILAYGFDLGEEVEWPAEIAPEEEGDWPDLEGFIARRAGLIEPDGDDYKDPAWSAYWAAKRVAVAAFPIDIVAHCSGEYPMFVVAIRRTVQTAKRGDPAEVELVSVYQTDHVTLQRFCEEIGLEYREPTWLLFSMWM